MALLEAFCQEVLQAAGAPEADAACVAASLNAADSRGISSHGAARLLGVSVRRLLVGSTCATPDIRVVQRKGAVALLDGVAGLGSRLIQPPEIAATPPNPSRRNTNRVWRRL